VTPFWIVCVYDISVIILGLVPLW